MLLAPIQDFPKLHNLHLGFNVNVMISRDSKRMSNDFFPFVFGFNMRKYWSNKSFIYLISADLYRKRLA